MFVLISQKAGKTVSHGQMIQVVLMNKKLSDVEYSQLSQIGIHQGIYYHYSKRVKLYLCRQEFLNGIRL